MRHPPHRRCPRTNFRAVLYGCPAFHPVRYRSDLPLPVGFGVRRPAHIRLCRNDDLHSHTAVRLYIPLEEGRAQLGPLAAAPRETTSLGTTGYRKTACSA